MLKPSRLPELTESIISDIANTEFPEGEVLSVVLGGGTPALLEESQLNALIGEIRRKSELYWNENTILSFETTPQLITKERMSYFKKAGFNRVSVGIQSFHREELRLLGRSYDKQTIEQNFKRLRECGFHDVNLDLLIGFPGQSFRNVKDSIEEAVRLKPEYISINLFYSNYDGGARFVTHCKNRGLKPIEFDDKQELYLKSCELLEHLGYIQVTNTLFTLPNINFQYELDVISNLVPILGFGPGSFGLWDDGIRYTSHDMQAYLKNPQATYDTSNRIKYAFTIIWGILNTHGKCDNTMTKNLMGITLKEILEQHNDLNDMLSLLVNKELGYFYEQGFRIRHEKKREAIVLMHEYKNNR